MAENFGFLCHRVEYNDVMELSLEEAGEIWKALYQYAFDGVVMDYSDRDKFFRSQYEHHISHIDDYYRSKSLEAEQGRLNGYISQLDENNPEDSKIKKQINDISKKFKNYHGTVQDFREEFYDHPAYVFDRKRAEMKSKRDTQGYPKVPQGTHNSTKQNTSSYFSTDYSITDQSISDNVSESNRPETNAYEKSTDIAAGEDEILHYTDSELRLEIGKIFMKNRLERFNEDEGRKLQTAIYEAVKGKPLTYAQLESEVVKMIDQNDLPF